jgi:16S rRNA (guanine1207-N2)-methyltransferase
MPLENIDKLREDLLFSENLRGCEFNFRTTWGLFNPKRIDLGSRLLIDYVEAAPNANCLDIGCGYGPIGLALAKMCPEGQIHMVDKDFVAVDYAQKNAELNDLKNCHIYLSNGLSHVPEDLRFDRVVSNLPAKVGNELLSLFLHDARARLLPGGRLYVVTIAGLKNYIKRNFREIFGNFDKVKQRGTYLVSMAEKE